MNETLEEIIFMYLDHITDGSNVYNHYDDSLWIINSGKNDWYFDLENNGTCWIRYKIMKDISTMFNIKTKVVREIMGQWVETTLKKKVILTDYAGEYGRHSIESVIGTGKKIKTLGKQSDTITENEDTNEKLKELIFQYLNLTTEGSNIYKLDGDYAIINPIKNQWYFQLYRPHRSYYIDAIFFNEILTVFYIEPPILINFIKEWLYKIFESIENNKYELKTFDSNVSPSGWIMRNIEKGEIIKTLGGESNTINESEDKINLEKLILSYLDTLFENGEISYHPREISFRDSNTNQFTYYPDETRIKVWKSLPTDISLIFGLDRSDVIKIIKIWAKSLIREINDNNYRSFNNNKYKIGDLLKKRDSKNHLNENIEEQLKPLIFKYWDALVMNGKFQLSDIVDDYDIINSEGKVLVMNSGTDIGVNVNFFNDIYNIFGLKKEKRVNPFLRPYINEWGKSIFDNMTDTMKVSDAIKKRDKKNSLNEELNPRLANIIFEYLNHILANKKIMFYHGDYADIGDIYPIVDNNNDHEWYLAWDSGNVRINSKLIREIKTLFPIYNDELLEYIGTWYGMLLKKIVKHSQEFKYPMKTVIDFSVNGRFTTTVSDLIKINEPKLSLNEEFFKIDDVVLQYIDYIVKDYEIIKHFEEIPQTDPKHTKTWLYFINPKTYKWLFIFSDHDFYKCVNIKFKEEVSTMFNINEKTVNRILKKWFKNNDYNDVSYIDYECNPRENVIKGIVTSHLSESKKLYRLTEDINDLPTPNLKYYAFDWDDNIVKMPTQIMLLSDDNSMVGMSTKDFAKYRESVGKENFEYKGKTIVDYSEEPFKNFGVKGDKDFLIDSMLAEPGPSWRDFVEAINNGSIFAVITARGHNPETLKQGVYNYIISDFNGINKNELVKNLKKYRDINNMENLDDIDLIREYLNLCKFYPVSFGNENEKNPEHAKVKALKNFVKYIKSLVKNMNEKIYIKNNVKNYFIPDIGFSDDDIKNVTTIKKHFKDNKVVKTFFTGNNNKEIK